MIKLRFKPYVLAPLLIFIVGCVLIVDDNQVLVTLISQLLAILCGVIIIILFFLKKMVSSLGKTLLSILMVFIFFVFGGSLVVRIEKTVKFLLIKNQLRQTVDTFNTNAKVSGIKCIEIRSKTDPKALYFLEGMTEGGFMSSGRSWGYMYIDRPLEIVDYTENKILANFDPKVANKKYWDFFRISDNWYYLTGNGFLGSLLSPSPICYTKIVFMR